MTLKQEFAIIEAEHAIRSRQSAQIKILQTRLRIARQDFVPITEKFRMWKLLEKYPEFREPEDPCRRVI